MARIKCPHCGRTFEMPTTLQAKGGRTRAKNLTPERRQAIARKAAETRWLRQRAQGETT